MGYKGPRTYELCEVSGGSFTFYRARVFDTSTLQKTERHITAVSNNDGTLDELASRITRDFGLALNVSLDVVTTIPSPVIIKEILESPIKSQMLKEFYNRFRKYSDELKAGLRKAG